MKKFIIAMLLCMVGVGFVGCSSNNDDEPTEQYTFQKIKGRWYQTAYLNSDNYFTDLRDGSYIEFETNGYVYNDASLKYTETGAFVFNEATNEILFRTIYNGKEREWKATIQFETDNNATFILTGLHNITIKTEKNRQ